MHYGNPLHREMEIPVLNDLSPKDQRALHALPLLGPVVDEFSDWLTAHEYRYRTRRRYLLRCVAIDRYFVKHRRRALTELTAQHFQKCRRFYQHRPGEVADTVSCLKRFLLSRQLIPPQQSSPIRPFRPSVDAYRQHLAEVRGLAVVTIERHCSVVSEFFRHALKQDGGFRLVDLTPEHSERFITAISHRLGRQSLQKVVAILRCFLRFLGVRGEAPLGLEARIDTPRVYREEQLPRALPWDSVRAFLDSIDRTTTAGLRDYAMLSLIAAYGLRGCDVAGLKLNDIDWRAGEVRIIQSKTRQPIVLPLTDPAGEAVLAYLQGGRPRSAYRQIFLKAHAPIAPLQGAHVSDAFRFRLKHSGLDIRARGVYCLRHSHAMHLLRQGVPLKTIGDLLGHRRSQSTGVYLRLDIDDLRDVTLPLPGSLRLEESSL
jgi:integrase/recombinase XerD